MPDSGLLYAVRGRTLSERNDSRRSSEPVPGVVALHGATDPGRTGPVGDGHRVLQAPGVPCVPCRSRTCRHLRPMECMERISVDEVFKAAAEIVGEGRPGAGKAGSGESIA